MNRDNMTWEEFASQTRTHQIGLMGKPNEVRPGRGGFHENPSSCICEYSEAKRKGDSVSQSKATIRYKNAMMEDMRMGDGDELAYEQLNEDEQDWSDTDDAENGDGARGTGLASGKDSNSGSVLKPEQQELDEMLSD